MLVLVVKGLFIARIELDILKSLYHQILVLALKGLISVWECRGGPYGHRDSFYTNSNLRGCASRSLLAHTASWHNTQLHKPLISRELTDRLYRHFIQSTSLTKAHFCLHLQSSKESGVCVHHHHSYGSDDCIRWKKG